MGSGFIFTNDNCVSCYKCVRVCTSPGASFVSPGKASSVVHVEEDRCISCGACFALCDHNARDYIDDTDYLLGDLMAGEPISLLVAPSFPAAYPHEYASILGGLKKRGIRRIISVAFGADICTWAYLKYIKENNFYGGISTTCPVIVSYVEHYLPELIPLLIPVQSPLRCAATYCREVLGITDRLAFLGPCIGKKMDTDFYHPDSPVEYNVTYLKLMERVRQEHIYGPDVTDEIEYGLGTFYPAPGGLTGNLRWFLGGDTLIRTVSGKTYIHGWLSQNAKKLKNRELPYYIIDALNCQEGCLEGTASESTRFDDDTSLCNLQYMAIDCKSDRPDSPWNPALSLAERLEMLNKQFGNLELSHYICKFTDRSEECKTKVPTPEQAERIFRDMRKTTPESRVINCSFCGYNTCYDLMTAIFNGFNTKRSCIHYEIDEAVRFERLSMYDQLTGVMNRSGLQHVLTNQYRDKALAVIAVDVNGLKYVNDTFGHEAGDKLIVEAAGCLSAIFGGNRVFRTGGDEFVIIQQDHTEEKCIADIKRLREHMKEHGVSAAIGYSYKECFSTGFAEMQAIADKNMYEDKARYYKETGKVRRTQGEKK